MTPSYAETLRPTTSESTAATPATEAPLDITRAPALNGNHVGERIELGRYRTDAGVERVLYGQCIATVVRVTDVPVDHPGRAYLVERGLEEDGYAALFALVRDYLDQANRLGVPPMSTTVLNNTASEALEGGDR